MECPFNALEPFDFHRFGEEAIIRIEQVSSMLKMAKYAYQDDNDLYPALSGMLRLLDSLCQFVCHTGSAYENFEKAYIKKRALAEACGSAKTPTENRGETESVKIHGINQAGSQAGGSL